MEKSVSKDLRVFDAEIRERVGDRQGFIAGVDEAGRGPLAGSVFAAAVILKPDADIFGLNDSKKLTEKKRESLFSIITAECLSYAIAAANVFEIEEYNILKATHLAMQRAVSGLTIQPAIVLVDGNSAPDFGMNTETVIGGDAKSAAIAAASVLAKVSRDRYMCEVAKEYPEYMFEKHKGYGTKLHCELLLRHGPSPVHRKSFLKKILKDC